MGRPVVHWEIGGRDVDRLATFYGELFGWKTEGFDSEYRMVQGDGGTGGGLMRCREGVPPYVTLYVAVDDLEAMLQRVEQLGGERLVAPAPIPGVGSFALFKDPEGNTIGMLQLAATNAENGGAIASSAHSVGAPS